MFYADRTSYSRYLASKLTFEDSALKNIKRQDEILAVANTEQALRCSNTMQA